MIERTTDADPEAVLLRLQEATNAHDLEALVACFAVDVISQQPAHPARDFQGRDQIHRNWQQLFGAVPDLKASLLRSVAEGQTVWAEWLWTGTRPDGSAADMAGVTILEVAGEEIARLHFYMEPIERGQGIDASIRQQASGR